MSYRVGIDIGGTFTDFALLSESDGRLFIHKQLTTPDDPAQSVLSGVPILLEKAGVGAAQVSAVVHGTTLVTNAVIERRGAKTAMIVTDGFGDILDIARERRYDMYDLAITYPAPLVPRALRREIKERIGPDGSVDTPLVEDDVAGVLQELADQGVTAVAVCFLNSPVNPAHEQAVAHIAAERFPDLFVSASSDVFPFLREYERWTTATMNAYTGPLFDRYLARLEDGLRTTGLQGDLFIMSSSGGTVTPDVARQFPVRMLESGPAAGVLQSATLGRQLKRPNLLSFDMGGTTAKGALVRNDQPLKRYEMEVARVHEFRAGSGLPAKIPVIDLIEIGSGGGSIAAIDARGTIAVGPHSAGAVPGPACYGQGGGDPTLTDANLTLGYLDDAFFLGGEMRLDTAAAAKAIDARLGTPLGIETLRAAWGIHESVNEDIARAFRNHASERGFDYRACAMVAFGGSGPAHACRVARKLRVPTVIFPVGAGVMSAVGLLASPLSFETFRAERMGLETLTTDAFSERFDALVREAQAFLGRAATPGEQTVIRRRLDMRYRGQGYEIEVDLPAGADVDSVAGLFTAAYERIFTKSFPSEALEITNWKIEVALVRANADAAYHLEVAPGKAAIKGHRLAYFPENPAPVRTPVYDRYALAPGETFSGPALVEERESTCVIGAGDHVAIDPAGNLIVSVAGGRA
ncbi:MAG: hydantoinase/oxoprolinase family protein [Alphaproteobacteria bacterium]